MRRVSGFTNARLSSSSRLALQSMQDLGLLQDKFLGVPVPSNIVFLQLLTPFPFRSFSASSGHLFLSFPTELFLSEVFLNTSFTFLLLVFFSHVLNFVIFLL